MKEMNMSEEKKNTYSSNETMTAIFVVCFVSMCLLWIRFNRNAWRRHSEEEEEGKTNTRLCHALQTHSIRHVVTLQCNSLFFDIHKHIFPLCSHHRHSSTLAPHNLKQHAIAYEQREKKRTFSFSSFSFSFVSIAFFLRLLPLRI